MHPIVSAFQASHESLRSLMEDPGGQDGHTSPANKLVSAIHDLATTPALRAKIRAEAGGLLRWLAVSLVPAPADYRLIENLIQFMYLEKIPLHTDCYRLVLNVDVPVQLSSMALKGILDLTPANVWPDSFAIDAFNRSPARMGVTAITLLLRNKSTRAFEAVARLPDEEPLADALSVVFEQHLKRYPDHREWLYDGVKVGAAHWPDKIAAAGREWLASLKPRILVARLPDGPGGAPRWGAVLHPTPDDAAPVRTVGSSEAEAVGLIVMGNYDRIGVAAPILRRHPG